MCVEVLWLLSWIRRPHHNLDLDHCRWVLFSGTEYDYELTVYEFRRNTKRNVCSRGAYIKIQASCRWLTLVSLWWRHCPIATRTQISSAAIPGFGHLRDAAGASRVWIVPRGSQVGICHFPKWQIPTCDPWGRGPGQNVTTRTRWAPGAPPPDDVCGNYHRLLPVIYHCEIVFRRVSYS